MVCIPQVTTHKHLAVHLNDTDSVIPLGHYVHNMGPRLEYYVYEIFRKIFLSAVQSTLKYACAVWSGGPTAKRFTLGDILPAT